MGRVVGLNDVRADIAMMRTPDGLAELGAHNLVEHNYESARAAYTAVLTQLRSSDTR